jgi:hypothetical protein
MTKPSIRPAFRNEDVRVVLIITAAVVSTNIAMAIRRCR